MARTVIENVVESVPEPDWTVARAVSIAAPPEAVWYAYDLFDNDDSRQQGSYRQPRLHPSIEPELRTVY